MIQVVHHLIPQAHPPHHLVQMRRTQNKPDAKFFEWFEPKQNPFKGEEAWNIEVVSEIKDNLGEYYSDDPMASEESEVDDDFKPMDLEQRRYNM